MSKGRYVKLLIEMGYEPEELKEMDEHDIKDIYEDIMDTSWAHPNETYEEFMEHEEF